MRQIEYLLMVIVALITGVFFGVWQHSIPAGTFMAIASLTYQVKGAK